MSGVAQVELDIPQRQSLWAVGFLALRTLRQVGLLQLALLIGFVLARLPSVAAFIGLVAVVGFVLLVVAAVQWWRYTFVLDGDKLVVQRGIWRQQTLSVPLGRVQSVSLEQKLLHRIVSLVQVSLDTAGTETAEFIIDAVDQPVAQALQRAVADFRQSSTAEPGGEAGVAVRSPPPPEQIILRHAPGRILRVALSQTPFAGLVLVVPVLAVADDAGQLLPFDLPTIDEPTAGPWLLWFVPLLLIVGLVVSVILNLVRVVLTDWALTLRSTAAGLRRDAGLLSTTSVAAPVPRVQMVRVSQGLLERLFSLHTLNLATIGSVNLALPGCTIDQVTDVRRLALAESEGVDRLDGNVSPTEVFLRTRNSFVVAVILVAVLPFLIGWWSLLPFVSVPWIWARTRREVRLRRWGMNSEAVADHREFLGWKRQELLLHKLNGVSVGQRLFEYKRGLATVTFSTAAGSVSIGMIPLEQARQLRDQALYAVETDRRVWM